MCSGFEGGLFAFAGEFQISKSGILEDSSGTQRGTLKWINDKDIEVSGHPYITQITVQPKQLDVTLKPGTNFAHAEGDWMTCEKGDSQ